MRCYRRWFGMAFGLVGLVMSPALSDEQAAPTAGETIALKGKIFGPYTVNRTNPDIGSTYELSGSGQIQPLGQSRGTGSFRAPGNVAVGHAEGTLTLTDQQGSVTLTLVGPDQRGLAPPPDHFTYTITGGTGTFQGAKGSGNVALEILLPGRTPPRGGPGPRTHVHLELRPSGSGSTTGNREAVIRPEVGCYAGEQERRRS